MSLLAVTTSVLCLVAFSAVAAEKHWALLVAGSNGYDNYRHQADICHAYHVIRSHGIPDERIIVMMYDDIANNQDNPYPGNIINQPDGPNVYEGVPKDYTGEDVTPEVFLKVLSGDSEGVKNVLGREGKVINSGPDDRIFVNFADHGAPGLLAFPEDELHAEDLHKTIKDMYTNQKYKQMVFYVEACESGSMFDNILEDDINVFATTAANPDESSYACYFDEKRSTYLGDVYSVMWMQDSDKENLKKETLQSQFKLVKEETNTSHVMEYGDLKMGSLTVAEFQGSADSDSLFFIPTRTTHPAADAVPSEDVKMHILMRKLVGATGEDAVRHRIALAALMQRKQETEEFFKRVVLVASRSDWYETFLRASVSFTDFTCYRESLKFIKEVCPGMNMGQNDYALRKLRVLANMCESDIPQERIWAAIVRVADDSSICKVSA